MANRRIVASFGFKIAFVSPHCLVDFTNGAATATLDQLAVLAQSAGWR